MSSLQKSRGDIFFTKKMTNTKMSNKKDPELLVAILRALAEHDNEGGEILTRGMKPWVFPTNFSKEAVTVDFTGGRGVIPLRQGNKLRGSIPFSYQVGKTWHGPFPRTGNFTPHLLSFLESTKVDEQDVVVHCRIRFSQNEIRFDLKSDSTIDEPIPAFQCAVIDVAKSMDYTRQNGRVVFMPASTDGMLEVFLGGVDSASHHWRLDPTNLKFKSVQTKSLPDWFRFAAPQIIVPSETMGRELSTRFMEGRMDHLKEVINEWGGQKGLQQIDQRTLDNTKEDWYSKYQKLPLLAAPPSSTTLVEDDDSVAF